MNTVYPQPIINRSDPNLKLGIKSSLPEIKQLVGLVISIYIASKQSILEYGRPDGSRIVFSDEHVKMLQQLFVEQLNSNNIPLVTFTQVLNSNPLVTKQMEPLQAALERYFKLCKVNPSGSSSSAERQKIEDEIVRSPKQLRFTTNIEIIRLCFNELEIRDVLFNWIMEGTIHDISKTVIDPNSLDKICSLLTIFSEETHFKIRNKERKEIEFQQESIYHLIEEGEKVEDKDAKEDVGPFRIFKRFVALGLHPYIQNNNGFLARPHANWPGIKDYYQLVSAYLDVIPKHTTVTFVEDNSNDDLIQPTERAIPLPDVPRNRILFGPPGTGKSFRVDELYANSHAQIRVTFHPDSEYHSFVGSYKPVSDADGLIHYSFVPQAFTKAYLSAWSKPTRAVFLIIEEINRGNCAQIFGDLFQSLDRNNQGFSVYPVDADTDLANFLESKGAFGGNSVAAERFADVSNHYRNVGAKDYHKMILPNNLYIYATMNTSDQSLFPMDSAFKRRWDWEYVPIDYVDAHRFTIELTDSHRYSWGTFIKAVNRSIYALNQSEDKQLGNRFVNPTDSVITLPVFKSKVMAYLWSEIYKNETDNQATIFISQEEITNIETKFTFAELFERGPDGNDRDIDLLTGFMRKLGVATL